MVTAFPFAAIAASSAAATSAARRRRTIEECKTKYEDAKCNSYCIGLGSVIKVVKEGDFSDQVEYTQVNNCIIRLEPNVVRARMTPLGGISIIAIILLAGIVLFKCMQ